MNYIPDLGTYIPVYTQAYMTWIKYTSISSFAEFQLQWHVGIEGTSPSQFHIPHSVDLDSYGRVWVADRMNGRIQAFDAKSGKYIGEWTSCFQDGQPYSVR